MTTRFVETPNEIVSIVSLGNADARSQISRFHEAWVAEQIFGHLNHLIGVSLPVPSPRRNSRTLELRNVLEYEQFNQELARMTAEAIASVGSKLDAYQRMFDDEVDDDTFDRHIRSAERPYAGRGNVNEDAARVAEEVMDGVVLSESQPDP